MNIRARISIPAIMLCLLAGCDRTPTPLDFCVEQIKIVCVKYFECGHEQLSDQCSTDKDLEAFAQGMGIRCDPDYEWECNQQRDNARKCLDQLSLATCSDFPQVFIDSVARPAACQAMKCAAQAGEERGPCRTDGTCDSGLVCLSDLCVRPADESDTIEPDTINPVYDECGVPDISNVTPDTFDLAGKAWKFDSLSILTPFSESIGEMVGDYLTTEINNGYPHIVFDVSTYDVDTGEIQMALGTATKIDDGYHLNQDRTESIGTLRNNLFETTDSLELTIVCSSSGDDPPPTLPLKNVRLVGVFSQDLEFATAGTLTALLTVEDADSMALLGSTWNTLLESLSVVPDVDTDSNGTMDAYTFKACFTASHVTLN